MLISIGQAASLIGVAVSTLRRWEQEGRLQPAMRTKGGHRRYRLADIERDFFGKKVKLTPRKIIAYARVSSHDQRLDLKRQIATLEAYCKKAKRPFSLISDCGSGINYQKRGLSQLIKEICSGGVERLVLTHRDRLLRFGSPLLFKICEFHGTEVIVLSDQTEKTFEEALVGDVLEVMTVFCAKVYGRRSHANRLRHRAEAS